MIALRIQVLFHWESEQARKLATSLYRTFSARPMGDGPRIPVRYGPRQADGGPPPVGLDAEREIIVILVDERMARRARAIDRPIADKWGLLVSELLGKHPRTGASPHRVLPIALDGAALQLAPGLNDVSFVRLDVTNWAFMFGSDIGSSPSFVTITNTGKYPRSSQSTLKICRLSALSYGSIATVTLSASWLSCAG